MQGVKWILAVLVCGLVAMPVGAATLNFVASLDGASEDPPTASPGTGSGKVTIDTLAKTMAVYFEFDGLVGLLTAAHIHGPTAVAGSGNAAVMTQVPTFPGVPLGVSSGTYSNVFDMTLASSYNPSFLNGEGGDPELAFAMLTQYILAGTAYLNLHSDVYGAGEIRGFLQPAPIPLPGAVWLMLAGAGVLGAAGRRRA
jgi:hypothetical protein